jgi:hypothetical protein
VPCLYGIVFGALAGVHVESVDQLRNADDAKTTDDLLPKAERRSVWAFWGCSL